MAEYLFDCKAFYTIRINARNETQARNILRDKLSFADANLGAFDNGDPILTEVCLDGTPELMEIDGEATQ